MERRADDSRVGKIAADLEHLHGCVESLKSQVSENTALTKEVRDILATFKVLGAAAKWLTILGAGATTVYHGLDWLRHK